MSNITFEIINGIMAKATYQDGELIKVKIISKVSKGYYYSFLNWANEIAENLIKKHE